MMELRLFSFILLAFFLGNSRVGFAQNEDSTHILTELNRGFALAYSKPDSAKIICTGALRYAQKVNYQYGEMKALNVCGILQDITANYDSAISLYFSSIAIADKLDDTKSRAQVGNNVGLIYWNNEKLDSAIYWYRQSEAIFRKIDFKPGLANVLNNMGLIYNDQNDYDHSIPIHKEAFEIRKQLADTFGMGASLHNISMSYWDKNQYDSSIFYGLKAIPYRLHVKDLNGLSKTYNNLALAYGSLNKYAESIKYFQLAVPLKKQVEDKYGLASCYNNLGATYIEMQQSDSAFKYCELGYEIALKEKYLRVVWDLAGNLSKLYAQKGDFKNAYALKDTAFKYRSHQYEAETNERMQKLQVEFDVERKEAQLQTLSAEKKLADLDIERRNLQLLLVIGATLLLAIIALLGFIAFKRKKKLELERALREEKLQSSRAVIEATEEERNRIAKDLHDGIGQQLAALKLGWEHNMGQWKANHAFNPEEKEKYSKLLDATGADIRSISHRMMPRALQEKGLVPAIEEMLELTLSPAQVQFSFEHYNITQRFEKRLEVSLYRILQELVKNIIRHSKASQVTVQLMMVKKQLILIVEDNGVGFDSTNNTSDGMGLLSLRGRVDTVHGNINFEPSPVSGVLVTVRIPV